MTRTALNKGLIMRRVSGSHQAAQAATSSTSPPKDSDNAAQFLHESDVQSSVVFSDVCARVESGFSHFRSVMHDPGARVAAISTVDKEVEEPPCSRGQNLGWIRATHVCRLWRQVALGDASLWARIAGSPTNTELIAEMLVRARNAPLDVELTFVGRWIRKCSTCSVHTSPIRANFASMACLCLILTASEVSIVGKRQPGHFQLGVSITSPITIQNPGGKTLFKGCAPRLRTFSLFQVFIPWSLIPRGQLTQLKIVLFNEATTTDTPSRGNLNQFIDLLVNCPGLEILVLESCLPSQLSEMPYGQTIHLPRLSRLCLGGSSSELRT
ncbi:hypothetical protein BJV77DRAFT_140775 [Russula vinacea]|nr:hypothetical protein BJV77DRAFT_140775 [Russula vinacea]